MSDTLATSEFFDPVSGAAMAEQPVFDIASEVPKLPQVTDDASYAKLPAGAKFTDPEGVTRFKPIVNDADFAKLPEGAEFVGPDGVQRKKPVFENVNFTTQTLYDMALTDKEKRKILERGYPGKVKESPEGLYVEDEGTFRKPGRGLMALAGGATALAAPVAGAVLGTIGGGVAGVPGGPPGVFLAGTAGAGTGGTLGQGLNDIVLQLAGVYDRTKGEEFAGLGVAGLTSMMGAGVGRGIATVVPTLKEGISKAITAGPAIMRSILGTSEEDLRLAKQVSDKGTTVPPSAVAKGAPHLQNISERFHPALDTSNPTMRSIERHYERGAGEILKDLGVPEFQGVKAERPMLREPTAAPPVQRVGEALRERAILESKSADDALAAAIEQRKAAATANVGDKIAQREALLTAQVEAKEAAERLVQSGLDEMGKTADVAIKTAKAGHNSGDLWQAFGDQLVAVKRGVMDRASLMYRQADELAGNARPDVRGLPPMARAFLDQLPEDFQKKYPDIVQKLERLGGVFNKETGEMLKPPAEPTFGELRNLRTLLRGNTDWHTLSSDLKNGTYKFFSGAVNSALHPKEIIPLPAGLTANTRQLRDNLVEIGPGVHRQMVVTDSTGRNILEATLNKYGDDAYQLNHIVNNSKWQSEGGAAVRYKNLGEAAYIEAAKIAQREGKKLFAGASGETSEQARAIHRRLVDKGYATSPNGFGRIEVFAQPLNTPLREAAHQLDLADEFYRTQIPKFQTKEMEAVIRGLEAGLPADPKELYRVMIKEGHTDQINWVRKTVGENLWSGVKATDMRIMLDNSKDLLPGVTDGQKFVREVLDRHRTGLLDAVHSKDGADKIRRLAEEVRALTNDRVPIQVRQGDTVMEAIARARQAAADAKKVAAQDPMALLQKEMRQVEREARRQPDVKVPDPSNPGQFKLVPRKDDPLGFLYDPSVGAAEATKRILASEDLILATATRFGKDSSEFNMLRQSYAQKLLQGTMNPAERLGKVSDELQALMFPGVTRKQMDTLAKEMTFLTGTKLFDNEVAGGMAAMAKVEHPIAGRLVSGVMKLAPGVNMAARTALAAYYKMVTDFAANNPPLFNYLLRGLSGTAEEKQAVRAILTKHAQRYAAMGAGAGEALYQQPREERRR